MMKNNIIYMLKKELREVFRDKKSLAMMLIVPIMIPLLILGFSALFDNQTNQEISDYHTIGFSYELSDQEKELVKAMEVEAVFETSEELQKLLQQGKIYAYIDKQDSGYQIKYDADSSDSSYGALFADNFLHAYERVLQEETLITAGQNPKDFFDLFTIEQVNVGENSFYANYIVSYAFLFILMSITISATYPATDTTAGEKERGTLETLLTFPIKSRDIILGKLFSVTISSIITGLLGFVLALVSFEIANHTFKIFEPVAISLSMSSIVMSIVVIVIYSFFISGLCIAVASLSKTFKEAQSALTPLTFISFFPGMITYMVGIPTTPILSLVPFLNFSMIFNDISVGNINYLHIFLMLFSSVVYIGIVIAYIVKQYHSEKVLFSVES